MTTAAAVPSDVRAWAAAAGIAFRLKIRGHIIYCLAMLMAPVRNRMQGIEALRGAAALLVLLYHAARQLDRAGMHGPLAVFRFGHAGVDLFFVLSGFIILYVHGGDIGRPARLAHYAWRRFLRVVPPYWAALAVTLALQAATHGAPGWRSWIWSLLPVPAKAPAVVSVAWSLQCEIVFYAAFAVLILRRRLGLAVLGLWLAWSAADTACWAAGIATPGGDVIPPAFFGRYVPEFFAGMGVAAWERRWGLPSPGILLWTGIGLFACAALAENAGVLDGYAPPARLAYGLPAALIVGGAARSGGMRALTPLGAASYSIYLFQIVALGLAWQMLRTVPGLPAWFCFVALTVSGLALGLLAHRWAERKLIRAVAALPGWCGRAASARHRNDAESLTASQNS